MSFDSLRFEAAADSGAAAMPAELRAELEPEALSDEPDELQAWLSEADPAADLHRPAHAAAHASAHASPPRDPFFVGRVMAVVPVRLRGARLSPRRRAGVLAAFYGGAVLLSLLVASWIPEFVLGSVRGWSERAHTLAYDLSAGAGGAATHDAVWASWPVALGCVAAVCGLLLALAPSRVDTAPT
ncbi:MAG: hypothetical protein AAF721_26155 [Myxococcota bacterium]